MCHQYDGLPTHVSTVRWNLYHTVCVASLMGNKKGNNSFNNLRKCCTTETIKQTKQQNSHTATLVTMGAAI